VELVSHVSRQALFITADSMTWYSVDAGGHVGSQSGLTKHRADRVDLSNTYRVIVLVMG